MKQIFLILMTIIVFSTAFAGKHFDHILLYKNYGTWKINKTVIPSGKVNAGRLNWDGGKLIFTPPSGYFNTAGKSFFSFMIKVPKRLASQYFKVKVTYREGDTLIREFRAPKHDGWQGCCIFFNCPPRRTALGATGPTGRTGFIKQIEFSTETLDFQAVLDDIHFVTEEPDFSFPEHLFPQVTNKCFFPEFIRDDIIAETLADPEFKNKMAEIEKLRGERLPLKLQKMRSAEDQKRGIRNWAKIRDDGSITDITVDYGKRHHKERNFLHNYSETLMLIYSSRYHYLLNLWAEGYVPRTKENKEKFFKSMTRFLSFDINRRGDKFRYIGAGFVIPSVTVKAYRTFFADMDAVEKGLNKDPLAVRFNRTLKEASSWCYTFPIDRAEAPFLTVDSFRHSTAWTGGNFSYRPTFYTALICRNPRMIDVISEIAGNALELISYNTRKQSFWLDAMTADGSAWGHGNQNYPLGYPLSGVTGIGELIRHLQGTRWVRKGLNSSLKNAVRYLETTLWHGTGWSNKGLLQRDILSACGRIAQQYKGSDRGYGDFSPVIHAVKVYMLLFPKESPERKRLEHCLDVITGKKRLQPTGSRYFWNNDMLICRQKDSAAVVTMLSRRIKSNENAPSDSRFTDFWGEGSAWINKPFDAYRIARGFFKPAAIPGVTSRQWDFDHTGTLWRAYEGTRNFAGGAVDGDFAVCGFQMDRRPNFNISPDPNFYGLEASKAYFWLNGKLICLSAGITDRTRRGIQVATTLDQTLWRTPLIYGSGKTAKIGESVNAETNLLWHNGTGYAVLRGKGVLSAGVRTAAKWEKFDVRNKKRKDLPRTAPILMFQIDHGKNPKLDSCAYMVDMNCKDFETFKKSVKDRSVEILALTREVQAVREKSTGTLAAVFHIPGGKAGDLQVNAPAIVLLRELPDGRVRVTVSDPQQLDRKHNIVLKWKNKYYKINLPSGMYAGKSASVFLNRSNQTKETEMKKFTITLATAAMLCCSAQNLLKNPDFQQTDAKGNAASWTYPENSYQIAKDAESGKNVLKITLTRPETKARNTVYAHQRVAIEKPGKYMLSFTGKAVDCGFINMVWSLYDKNNKRVKSPTSSWTSVITRINVWQTISHVIDVPEGVKTIYISLSCRVEKTHKAPTGTMFVRSVKLSPVIEKK